MTLYGGIDLHSNNSYLCVIDEQDNRILEKRLDNDAPAIIPPFNPTKANCRRWRWNRPSTGTGWWMR